MHSRNKRFLRASRTGARLALSACRRCGDSRCRRVTARAAASRAAYKRTEGAMFVACSTLCFGRHPLDQALRVISELEFAKVEIAVHEQGPHLRPSQVAADVNGTAQRLRSGPSLVPAAYDAVLDSPDPTEYQRQL